MFYCILGMLQDVAHFFISKMDNFHYQNKRVQPNTASEQRLGKKKQKQKAQKNNQILAQVQNPNPNSKKTLELLPRPVPPPTIRDSTTWSLLQIAENIHCYKTLLQLHTNGYASSKLSIATPQVGEAFKAKEIESNSTIVPKRLETKKKFKESHHKHPSSYCCRMLETLILELARKQRKQIGNSHEKVVDKGFFHPY